MKSQKFDVILNRYSTLIIFLIPALTVFTLFVVLPIGEAAYYSFYRWNGYGDPEKFVGFKNYAYLFRNRVFIMSLKNNFYIIALSLFVQLPFALLVALMISDKIKGATFFRTIFFLPYILAEIVAGLIWAYIYDGNYGLVATIWGFFGIDPIFMVGDKDLALIAILIVIFWKYFGIHMMIYIAGLQAISKEVLEAAKVDERYIAQCNAQGFYPALYYPHNIHFLWAASTMEGRSELSIESALKVAKYVGVEQIKLFPGIEYFHTIPLLSYVRFGKWDEILAFSKPASEFKYSQGIYHYARGVAYAAKGELERSREEQTKILPLKDTEEVRVIIKGGQPSGLLLEIANELLLGQIEFSQNNFSMASKYFETAVNLQDTLPYTEPPFWYYPSRQSLGNSLMKEGKSSAAENVYKRDLKDYPRNGWSLFGLSLALNAQGKTKEAQEVKKKFQHIWQLSDIKLEASTI